MFRNHSTESRPYGIPSWALFYLAQSKFIAHCYENTWAWKTHYVQ